MGLFSTLTTESSSTVQMSSSSQIPTVLQLYTSQQPIALDSSTSSTSKLSGYSAMTYQAVQVGSSQEEELKNRHQNPDLGVWNCRVSPGQDKQALVDSLLAKLITTKNVRTVCWTVDLADAAQVEPSVSLMQSALVRHLIEHPPTATADPADAPEQERQTATTSLYQLQATQFGLANDDKESTSEKNINESFKDVKTTLMICALVPKESPNQEVSESAFTQKQAQALVLYHLRKFAAALNASLCFVQDNYEAPAILGLPSSQPSSPTKESQQVQPAASEASSQQPTVNYDTLSQLWRDLALDKEVWNNNSSENNPSEEGGAAADETAPTPLYGPGRQQDDLIETVLLRSGHYPGHWEANKDSLWVALPTPAEQKTETAAVASGDEGWLGQLRESIASAADVAPASKTTEESTEASPAKKDAAVSSFFESLLKNP
jgi:hypothetical protein